MAEIAENDVFTQVVEFEVDPAKQRALISAIVSEVERWVRLCPGFVSSTFHASLDGRHVLNYAQWRTEADFSNFTQHPKASASAPPFTRLLHAGLASQRRASRQVIYAADFAAMNGLIGYLTENCRGRGTEVAPACNPACLPAAPAAAVTVRTRRKSA